MSDTKDSKSNLKPNQPNTHHIYQSLYTNLVIACAKGVGAFISGSGAMLAETLHSFSDCANQLLLLLGVKRSQKVPDEHFPLGYGRSLYFWSFMVALLLFTGGGVFSIYEGTHKIFHPEALSGDLTLSFIILGVSLLLEGKATFDNLKEMKVRRGDEGLWSYLQNTKDSDLVVIFGENAAATLGLAVASFSLMMASITGDGRWDGVGSLSVGLILIAVAVFLAKEVQSLLLGESADPKIIKQVKARLDHESKIKEVHQIITLQQGPGEVLLTFKIDCDPHLKFKELSDLINKIEIDLRQEMPELKWIFIEPDIASPGHQAD
jgi:cation diffusion facilitator family transporter